MINTNLIKVIICTLILLFASICFSQTNVSKLKTDKKHYFSQDKVNRSLNNYYQNKNIQDKEKSTNSAFQNEMYKNSLYLNTNHVLQGREDIIITDNKSTLYIGPQADTFFVTTNYLQIGDIITLGQGVLLVDGATLTLYGHLNQFGDSKVILKNDAFLYVPQQYNAQYLHQLQDNACFESTGSMVDAKCVYQIRQYNNSRYVARQTDFPRWNFRKIWNESELILEDVTNTISDGFPSCTSPVDNGFLSFSDGVCRTFSSSWFNAVLLLNNTRFEPRPDHEVRYNIAHDESYFLAVNCTFIDSLKPYALNAALVMFTAIDSLSEYNVGTSIDVLGSAWIDAGPQNPVTFDCYNLSWSPAGNSVWTLLEESTNQVNSDVLATWNTTGLNIGEYDLRLMIRDSYGDSLTAYKTITLQNNTGTDEENTLPVNNALLQNYPNPFNAATTIKFNLLFESSVDIEIFNIKELKQKMLIKPEKCCC